MSRENPTWGAPRIQSELKLLGHEAADSTAAKYMIKHKKPPSQAWRSFLKNHVKQMAAVDLFTVPTVRFQILYCFIVLRHHRRRIVHFNITTDPTARWAAQQITETFPYDTAPKYLIRDRNGIYGNFFQQRVKNMGTREVLIAPKSPWQKDYASYCTSLVRSAVNLFNIFLSDNFVPCIFTGLSPAMSS